MTAWTILIEGVNIEYGKIENCNIDTNLTSKIWRRVTLKKNNGNIEFSIDLFNIDSKTGSNGVPLGVKRGHSIPYHHQQGAPHPPTPQGTPFDPILLSMLNKSMLNSMLPFSMLNWCQC